MAKKRIGKCALCGIECKLSFEHIPPKICFNKSPVKPLYGVSVFAYPTHCLQENAYLPRLNQQMGMGLYSLCPQCNNLTGHWYGSAYNSITKLAAMLLNTDIVPEYHSVELPKIYPLRIIKQIISMFCSLNPQYDIDDLRRFVLERDAVGIDSNKYRIFMRLTKSPTHKAIGFTSIVTIEPMESFMVSEITARPFDFTLYLDPINEYRYPGIDITAFAQCKYDDIYNVKIPLDICEVNTQYPVDYRTTSELVSNSSNRTGGINE